MNSNTPSLAELEIRLAKLERQNRRWKHLGLLFLLIAGAGFLFAQVPRKALSAAPTQAVQAATYDTLVVHRLELRDKAGKLRALLMAEGELSFSGLSNSAREAATSLGLVIRGPGLELYDTAGTPRAGLTEGRLFLQDANPKVWAILFGHEYGAGLDLHDTIRKRTTSFASSPSISLSTRDPGPALKLQDAQQFQAVVGVTETEAIKTGESHKTSAAAVTLFGKDGKVICRAP